jgi:hypothetical protein
MIAKKRAPTAVPGLDSLGAFRTLRRTVLSEMSNPAFSVRPDLIDHVIVVAPNSDLKRQKYQGSARVGPASEVRGRTALSAWCTPRYVFGCHAEDEFS